MVWGATTVLRTVFTWYRTVRSMVVTPSGSIPDVLGSGDSLLALSSKGSFHVQYRRIYMTKISL